MITDIFRLFFAITPHYFDGFHCQPLPLAIDIIASRHCHFSRCAIRHAFHLSHYF